MPTIHLIRHGHVVDADRGDTDPQLDALGLAQATSLADSLAARFPRALPILTSPLRRCRQTAAPLARIWKTEPRIEPRVTEIPSPSAEPAARRAWLAKMLSGSWPEAARSSVDEGFAVRLSTWQQGVLDAVTGCAAETIVFSHYFAINWICSVATDSERIGGIRPAHASVISLELEHGIIRLVDMGRQEAGGRQ